MMKAPVVLLSLALSVFAQDASPEKPQSAPLAAPLPDPTKADPEPDQWKRYVSPFLDTPQVNVDVLMVEVPEAAALKLLPDLRDPKKIEAAQAALLDLVGKKEASLLGWPDVTTHTGIRAVSETILEQRYPIEFEQPPVAQTFSGKAEPKTPYEAALQLLRNAGFVIPNTFETRNTGSTLEVEPVVSASGKAVTAQVAPQFVRLLKMSEYEAGKDSEGKPVTVKQPLFSTLKVNTNLTLRDGERRLIHVGKPLEPDGKIAFFILGVKIIPPVK